MEVIVAMQTGLGRGNDKRVGFQIEERHSHSTAVVVNSHHASESSGDLQKCIKMGIMFHHFAVLGM